MTTFNANNLPGMRQTSNNNICSENFKNFSFWLILARHENIWFGRKSIFHIVYSWPKTKKKMINNMLFHTLWWYNYLMTSFGKIKKEKKKNRKFVQCSMWFATIFHKVWLYSVECKIMRIEFFTWKSFLVCELSNIKAF